MKNAFYLMLKVLFLRKIFKFLSRLFVYVGKRLDKKVTVSKFMTSQTGQQIIIVHILPNIPRSKGNQTMKLSQVIEYNRIFFLEKSVRDTFIKNQNGV